MNKGHLQEKERELIFLYLNQGFSFRKIGKRIKRNHSVVLREIERNKDSRGRYSSFTAQKTALTRRTEANKKNPLKNSLILRYVKHKLFLNWSPEQISGRIKIDLGLNVCHETIYQYIYRKENKNLSLWVHLRRACPKRIKKKDRKVKREFIPNRIFIDQRPEYINQRKTIGHWESDLMLGKRETKEVVSVEIERKTKYLLIKKLQNQTSEEKIYSLIQTLEKLPPWLRKSITFDNGSENAKHQRIQRKLNLDTYFCHPYSSWERGTVENTIGLLRQYFPKKHSLENITQKDLNFIAYMINNRPRKCLGFLTPAEVFEKALSGAF